MSTCRSCLVASADALSRLRAEDFVAGGFTVRPYPEDSPIPYTPLTSEREQTWEREARKALKHIARTFHGKEGKARNGPTLLWRTLHHPPRHNYAPFPVRTSLAVSCSAVQGGRLIPRAHCPPQRVAQLDSLARKVLSDLRLSQDPPPSSSLPASSHSSSSAAPPLSSLSDELPEEEDLGLAHRLRVDDSGRIMLGQEHLFRDLLHPLPVPGSWVWGNVMLYECVATRPSLSLSLLSQASAEALSERADCACLCRLKRAVEGVDR